MENEKSKNQCQGCQAGWKIEEQKPQHKCGKTVRFHIVHGGYKHEKVMCTSQDYAAASPNKHYMPDAGSGNWE